MTKAFEERVKREGIVDTTKYRYVYKVLANRAYIERVEIEKLGTTEAINGWEIVKEWK